MSRKMNVGVFISVMWLVFTGWLDPHRMAGAQNRSRPEQYEFSAESPDVLRPVVIPTDILGLLKNDARVRDTLAYEGISSSHLPLSWFSAAVVHLGDHAERDVVIVAKPPLIGANTTTFWVFRPGSYGYVLVLRAAAHDLTLQRTRWRGYREIELAGETASTITTALFRFDGTRYRKYKQMTKDIH